MSCFLPVFCFLKCPVLFPLFEGHRTVLSVCVCQPGSVNLMVATIHLPSFLPSFLPSSLPSLGECYHSVSLPGTLLQSCRWDSRYELCAAQSDTLSTVEGKWERKGDIATRIKLSWYFQEAKTLFETKAHFYWIEDGIFLWRETTDPISPPPPQSVFSCPGKLIWNSDCLILGLTFGFFPPLL